MARDGYNIMPPFLPGGLDDFVDLVIPGAATPRFVPHGVRRQYLTRNLGLRRLVHPAATLRQAAE